MQLTDIARGVQLLNEKYAFLFGNFGSQLEAILCEDQFSAWICPRRSGKTRAAIMFLLYQAIKYPGCELSYIALTRPSAKRIVWKELKKICKEYKLASENDFKEQELILYMPNGSTIYIYGGSQEAWLDRMEGNKNRAVVIDEMGLHEKDKAYHMIYETIFPTLLDERGKLRLIGRGGQGRTGPFIDITNDLSKAVLENVRRGRWKIPKKRYYGTDERKMAKYSVYSWFTFDNPYMREQYYELKATSDSIDPTIWTSEASLINWAPVWIKDSSRYVYAYTPERNAVTDYVPTGDETYVIGIDTGWIDNTAFCVGCYSPSNPYLWILESFKEPGLLAGQISDVLEDMKHRYPGAIIWADPSQRHLVEELQLRYSQPIQLASKSNKPARIASANNDLKLGNVKFVAPELLAVVEEMQELRVKELRSGKKIENPAQPNDACDAFLYVQQASMHYRFTEPEKTIEYGTDAHWLREEKLIEERLEREFQEDSDPWLSPI